VDVSCVEKEKKENRKHPPRSPTQRVPPERDGNYDKPDFGQPQEEILMLIIWN